MKWVGSKGLLSEKVTWIFLKIWLQTPIAAAGKDNGNLKCHMI